MKAMVLAAGLGTRLLPITKEKPKALVAVKGAPILEIVLHQLKTAGVTEVIINLHHFLDQIIDFLKSKNNFELHIEFSLEEELLETGGGLKKAAHFFDDDEPFILHNVDVIHNIDLKKMIERHRANDSLATLAVNDRETSRYFIFDEKNRLCGWKSLSENKIIMARRTNGHTTDLAFCGIHVISPQLLEKLTEDGAFSIVDSYLRLAKEGEKIMAFRADEFLWQDIGKLQQLKAINNIK